MAKTNSKISAMGAVITNPITFTLSAGVIATVQANIQLLIDAVAWEETNPTEHRGYLDEMSPTARASLWKILTDLKAKTT
jgi:hypothetical protein